MRILTSRGEHKYELTGGHDVDKDVSIIDVSHDLQCEQQYSPQSAMTGPQWMDEVRGQVNGKLMGKIVPRFQFQAWSRDDLVALIQGESEWESLIHLLTEECKWVSEHTLFVGNLHST